MKCVQVYRREFDNLENRVSNAISEDIIGSFVEKGHLTARGVACEFISKMAPIKPYLGHDGKVYPQIYIKEIKLNKEV